MDKEVKAALADDPVDGMIIVGYVIIDDNNMPMRVEQQKNWYDKKRTATPAKIYKTEKVAARYGTPTAVYIRDPNQKL
jgi:hypothetical protein